jgi:hypothetical protein
MEKRNRNYILFASIIAVIISLTKLAQTAELRIQSDFVNIILTIIFYSPIIGFFYYLSGDARLKKTWKITFLAIAILMAVSSMFGLIVSLLS